MFAELISEQKIYYITFSLLNAISPFLAILLPIVTGSLITSFLTGDTSIALSKLLLLAGVNLFTILIGFVTSQLLIRLSGYYTELLRGRIVESYIYSPKGTHSSYSGKLLSLVQSDINVIINFMLYTISSFAVNVITVIGILAIAISINLLWGLVIAVLMFVIFMMFKFFAPKIKCYHYQLRTCNDKLFSEVNQITNGFKDITSSNYQSIILIRFYELLKSSKNQAMSFNNLSSTKHLVTSLGTLVANLIVIFYGFQLFNNGNLTATMFIAFITYSQKILGLMGYFSEVDSELQLLKVVHERYCGFMINTRRNAPSGISKIAKSQNAEKVTIRNLNFSYDGDNHFLRNLDMCFEPYKVNVITGKSGAGKSTLLSLIRGELMPSSGEILIGETCLNEIPYSYIHENFSSLIQEPYLFNMSIKENITLLNREMSESEMVDLCTKVGIHDFIERLPDAYETVIGNELGELSNGQKQRIALARLFSKKSKFFLLDEPTTGLDERSIKNLNSMIDQVSDNSNVIIVTHEPDLIKVKSKILHQLK